MGASIFFTAAMIRALRSARSFSHYKHSSPSDRNVNYDTKQLTGKKTFELFLLSVQVS